MYEIFMLAARRVGVGARGPRGPRHLAPKFPPYAKSLLHLPPRPPAADARLRLFLAPRPDLQPLYIVPSRFFSQPRRRNARVNTNARVRDNLRLLQRTPDDADLARAIFLDIRVEGGATLTEFAASAIASALLQAGKVEESVKVLEYARDKRVRAFPRVYIAVISAATKKKQHASLLRVWDALPDRHYKPFPWEYTSALAAAVQLKQKNQVFEILDKMKANEVEDDKIYGRVIAAACQTKQHELVCEILDYMHANGVDTAGMNVSARRLAFKSGEYDFVLELLRLMKTHGMDPTEGYKHQIRSLHKAGLHDRVQSVLEAMWKAGGVCDKDMYMTAVDSAIRVSNSELLMSILDDMKRKVGLAKTRTAVFRYAVEAAVLANQQQLVLDVFDLMHHTNTNASTAYIYVTAIRTAFKSKQYDFVLDILRKMTENGVDASGEYSHAVMTFNELECYDQVLRAFKGMRECGYDGGEGIVATAVEAAIKLERHEDVMAICNHDSRQYASALMAAVRLKQKKQVFEILDEVKVNEVKDDNLYGRVLGAACQAKQHELVCEILDYMHANGVDCTSAYVSAHRLAFKSGEYDFVLQLLRLMKTHGMDPTEQYKHHLMSLHKAGLHGRVQNVLEAMRKEGDVCDDDMYETAVDSAIRERDRDLVMSILDDMKRNADLSKTPTAVFPRAVEAAELTKENQFNEVKDDNMYGRVVGAACQAKQHELVCEILDYMHANGVDCTSAYVRARRLAFKSGEYDFVLQLLRLMKTHGMDPTEHYKHHLMSLHKAGLHGRVQSVLEAMRNAGCVCDEDVYMTAIDSAIRERNRDLVMSILDDMKRNADLSKTPTAVFPRAVEAAELTKENQLLFDVLDFMHHTDTATSAVYTSGIRSAFKSKQYDFVFDILRKMTENGVDASGEYSHAVMSFNKLECYDQVLRAFKAMRELGYSQEKVLCTTALQAATKLDRHDDVIAIYDGLSGKSSVTTPLHSHTLEQAHSTNKQGLVDSILQSIKKFTTGAE